jgi:hypothetical protein
MRIPSLPALALLLASCASRPGPTQAVLVEPDRINAASVAQWRRDGFTSIVALLDERHDRAVYEAAARTAGPDLYYWIEVGRAPALAEAHPEWTASLGMHADWRERFPGAALPKEGEVAKAFPWVPITTREAFDAQRARVERLLASASGPHRGVFLNDLQGGPSSCGCGNVQCRWATDYHVPATATALKGDDIAARFVGQIARAVPVIPVWTTECEPADLPDAERGTRLCGDVPCARGACPKFFAAQWTALTATHRGPVALLALRREFGRADPAWIDAAADSLDPAFPRERLWLVVEPPDAAAARALAARIRAAGIVVAQARVDQSYEPRIMPGR